MKKNIVKMQRWELLEEIERLRNRIRLYERNSLIRKRQLRELKSAHLLATDNAVK